MTTASACAKIILFGEHAVVYDRPALAVPLSQLRAHARVEARPDDIILIHAPEIGRIYALADAPNGDPLAVLTRLTLDRLGQSPALGLDIWIESEIPIAGGLGSGAAVSTALVRALGVHFGQRLTADEVSALVFQTEKIYHGTPSGIDNTVIAYEQSIRYVKSQSGAPIHIGRPFRLAVANTGVASPTGKSVADVRSGWERERARYEKIFDAIAAIVQDAQDALVRGENARLGELMALNQEQLRALDVSSAEIERLLDAGARVGISGKLSGGGRGGNVIFYIDREGEQIRRALSDAGATNIIIATVGEKSSDQIDGDVGYHE